MTEKYNPKVSVMIITYNQEDLIAETIESVLNQDYNNIEIVVSDDASQDRTPDIIRDYQRKYPNIIKPVMNHVNLGITGNTNAAFFACEGELIAVLGGDDLFLPGKISMQVKQFEDPDVVLSYHPVEIFLHQTGETLFVTNTTEKEKLHDVYDIISKGGVPGASSVMVRKSVCPEHGFDPSFPVVSDWIFYIEVALQGKVASLNSVYGKYRKHGKGASERTFELLSESLRTLDVVLERYGKDNEKLSEACRNGKYRYVLGELFRQVSKGDVTNISQLCDILLANSSGMKNLMIKVSYPFLSNKYFISVFGIILPKIKNFLKRSYA